MALDADAWAKLGAAGLGAMGGVGTAQQQRWINDFAINLLNENKDQMNTGYQDWLRQMTPTMFGAQGAGAGAQSRLFDDGGIGQNFNFALNNMWTNPGESQYSAQRTMSDYGGALSNDQMNRSQGDLYNLGNSQSRTAGIGDLATQGFQNGGWTPQRQQYLDAMSPLMQGQSQSQQAMLGAGQGFLGNGGANATTQNYMDRGNDAVQYGGNTPWLEGLIQNVAGIGENQGRTQYTESGQRSGQGLIDSGGYDPALMSLMNQGQSILASGGRTPQLDAGSNAALQGMATAGKTATTQGLQNRGLDLFGRESLLSPEQTASFAADASGRASKDAFEGVLRRAHARGGGAGANVAAGNATGVEADFADEMSQNKSKAIQDALLARQSLGLQQSAMGLEGAKAGQGEESNRFGMFGSLLNDYEGTASQRMGIGSQVAGTAANAAANKMGTGASLLNAQGQLEANRYLEALGLVPTAQNSATSRAGTIGGLGLTADSNNINRAGLGGSLLNNYTNSQQNAGNSMNQFIGNQDQYQQMLAALGLSAGQQQAGIMNNVSQNELAALNGGVNRAQTYGGLVNNQMNTAQNNINGQSALLQGSWNPLVALSGQSNDWGKQALSNISLGNVPNPGGSTSVWSSMAQGAANGLSGKK